MKLCSRHTDCCAHYLGSIPDLSPIVMNYIQHPCTNFQDFSHNPHCLRYLRRKHVGDRRVTRHTPIRRYPGEQINSGTLRSCIHKGCAGERDPSIPVFTANHTPTIGATPVRCINCYWSLTSIHASTGDAAMCSRIKHMEDRIPAHRNVMPVWYPLDHLPYAKLHILKDVTDVSVG